MDYEINNRDVVQRIWQRQRHGTMETDTADIRQICRKIRVGKEEMRCGGDGDGWEC